MATTADTMDVWYILINHEKNPLGISDKVLVSRDATVVDLEDKIKERRQHNLREVDTSELVVWRCRSRVVGAEAFTTLKSRIKSFDFSEESNDVEMVDPEDSVGQLGLVSNEKLLVQVPAVEVLRRGSASSAPDLAAIRPFYESNPYCEAVTFKVHCKELDGTLKPVWETVTIRNKYVVKGDLAQHIAAVVERARRVPDNEGFTEQLFEFVKEQIASGLLTKDKNAVPYSCWNLELVHYLHALTCMKPPPKAVLSYNEARTIVFGSFEKYWLTEVDGSESTFGKQLPFALIVRAENEGGTLIDKYEYQPRPDVTFLKHGLPRFLVEFDSSDNQHDASRLEIMMTCVLRLALAIQKEACINGEQFFLMGAFFSKRWEIDRYFFYAEGETIYFHKRVYQMKVPTDLTTFLFEFYNYAKHVKDNDTLGDKKVEIDKLTNTIKGLHFRSMFSKGSKGQKRSQPGEGHDSTDGGAGRSTGKHARTAMEAALRKVGFEVPDLDLMIFKPLVKLPAHVVEGWSGDGRRIIAKLPRKNSDELSLLHMLSSLKSPHNHAIPLLRTVESDLGPLIILPWATSLAHSISFELVLKDKVVQLSHELVEGIAFLHRQKIAHLDIKPDNLVYNYELKRLYIIDFDLAMQCKDVDEMVEFSCGTPGWSAPEIVHDDDRPLRAFSPIRADLWSCGRVLWSFETVGREKDADLSMLMRKLMDVDPRRRPLLHEVVDEEPDFWTSGRLHQALTSNLNGRVQQTTAEGSVKLKRARDDAGGDCLACKFVRKANDSSGAVPFHVSPPVLLSSTLHKQR